MATTVFVDWFARRKCKNYSKWDT